MKSHLQLLKEYKKKWQLKRSRLNQGSANYHKANRKVKQSNTLIKAIEAKM